AGISACSPRPGRRRACSAGARGRRRRGGGVRHRALRPVQRAAAVGARAAAHPGQSGLRVAEHRHGRAAHRLRDPHGRAGRGRQRGRAARGAAGHAAADGDVLPPPRRGDERGRLPRPHAERHAPDGPHPAHVQPRRAGRERGEHPARHPHRRAEPPPPGGRGALMPDTDRPVYLDYAATAPVLPEVAARMAEVLAMGLGNAASDHAAGRAARELVEAARAEVAALAGCDPADIVFTSGATESNNLAIVGTARAAMARGARPHLVSLATEHKSVLEPLRMLAAEGCALTLLKPDADGVLPADVLAAAIRPETCLVTLLHVNNETGVAQDIPALAAVCAGRGVPLHVDAAQSAGKLPLTARDIALLSFTAHKLGGPQGIGALYVAPAHRGRLKPRMLGGGHERGLRAGTLATHQIAGFGLACRLAAARREREAARLTALRERLWQGLADLPGVLRNGRPGAPH